MNRISPICCLVETGFVLIQQEGSGWRVARDPQRNGFTVLLGGQGWAFELTEPEWTGFCELLVELVRNHAALVDQLMAEEAIELELERGPWWGCLEGDRERWSLSVVLTPEAGRGVEGHWPCPAAMALIGAVRTMWDSSRD